LPDRFTTSIDALTMLSASDDWVESWEFVGCLARRSGRGRRKCRLDLIGVLLES
jgi:hypothetical protein